MEWKILSFIVSLCVVHGALLVAAAKSIFVVKSQVYGPNGMPLYVTQKDLEQKNQHLLTEMNTLCRRIETILSILVPRTEWEATENERMLRYTNQQKNLSYQIERLVTSNDKMQQGQIDLGNAVAKLQTLITLRIGDKQCG